MTATHAEQLDRALDLIPPDRDNLVVKADGKRVSLTNLRKVYFPSDGFTKGDLLRSTPRRASGCCRTSWTARW